MDEVAEVPKLSVAEWVDMHPKLHKPFVRAICETVNWDHARFVEKVGEWKDIRGWPEFTKVLKVDLAESLSLAVINHTLIREEEPVFYALSKALELLSMEDEDGM